MSDSKSEESRSMESMSDDASSHSSYSGEWESSTSSGSDTDTMEADSVDGSTSSHSRSTYEEESDPSEEDKFDESSLHRIASADSGSPGGHGSDDDTDTCLLSIDEHVKRRKAKEMMMSEQQQEPPKNDLTDSEDSTSLYTKEQDKSDAVMQPAEGDVENDLDSRSDDETDTCMLSIDEHVRRRYAKWKKYRATFQRKEPVDLACIVSDDAMSESRAGDSETMENSAIERSAVDELPKHENRRFDDKQGEDWRIKNWRKKEVAPKGRSRRDDRALKGVTYMPAIDMASTNRDISVVEPGISKKAAREAFEKEVPDEIPVMLNDDVSSIYPPLRTPTRFLYPPKRAPLNGMILEDPVSYDEELGDSSTKHYEMSIVGSGSKKKTKKESQRSDIELILIAVISLSLLILVILLIVILAKNS